MMQQFAAQKTEIASQVQIGMRSSSSEQNDSGRGQEFASMLEQSKANEKQPVSNVNRQETKAKPNDNQAQMQAKEARQDSSSQNQEAEESIRREEQAARSEGSTDAKLNDSQATTERNSESETNSNDQAAADANSEQDSAEEDLHDKQEQEMAKEEAVHFDWLEMLDKLHGQNTETVTNSDVEVDPELIAADSAVVNDLQETLNELLAKQEGGEMDLSTTTDINRVLPSDEPVESEPLEQSLSDIFALIDSLKGQKDVPDEALQELDQMIDEFMASNPNLEESPLKELKGADWMKVDAKLLTQLLNVNDVNKNVESVEVEVDDELTQKLLKADPSQVQKVVEYIAQNVLPKEVNTAQAKESFKDTLKSGVEEMKAQLKQGHEPAIDLSQMVKDAVAAASDVENSGNVEQGKLQLALATANKTMDMAGQLADSKVSQQETPKVGNNTKELNAAQVELNRQHQASQIERTVNINKPDAPQHLADKVQLMVNQKNMVAEIRLDPPEMGTVKVKINMSGDSASVSFVVQSQHTREALEQATPKLKELLDEQGIELGQSSVDQENGQQQDAEGANGRFAGGSDDENLDADDDFSEQQTVRVVNGSVNGIDYFA